MHICFWHWFVWKKGLFTIYKRFPEKSGWKVDGTRLFALFQRTFPGAAEHLKRWSCFSGRNTYCKRDFEFHFFKAIFDTSFRPSRSFFGKWNWKFVQIVKATPGWNFNHWPKPWTDQFARVNDKQPGFSRRGTLLFLSTNMAVVTSAVPNIKHAHSEDWKSLTWDHALFFCFSASLAREGKNNAILPKTNYRDKGERAWSQARKSYKWPTSNFS